MGQGKEEAAQWREGHGEVAMRTAIKRFVMTAYCYGYLPAAVVVWCFRVFRLKHE